MPHKKQYICSVCKNPFYRRASTINPLLLDMCDSCIVVRVGTMPLDAKQSNFPKCPTCGDLLYRSLGETCSIKCSMPSRIEKTTDHIRRERFIGYMIAGKTIVEISRLEKTSRQAVSQLVIKLKDLDPKLKAFYDKTQADKCAAKYLWCVDCHNKKTSKFVWDRVHPEGKEYRCKECRLETLYIEVPCDACGHIFERRRKEFFYTQHTGKKKKSFYCCNLCKSDGMKGIPISQRGDINLRDETSQ